MLPRFLVELLLLAALGPLGIVILALRIRWSEKKKKTSKITKPSLPFSYRA